MLIKAKIEDGEYQKKVRDLISRILQAAFKSKDLKTFLDEIVKVGAEKTEAKSCDIFLLEESEDGNGRILRVYATSGKVGEILKEKEAWYYVPKREPFKEEGESKRKVIAYLKKYFTLRSYLIEKCGYNEKELLDELQRKSLREILKEKKKSPQDAIGEIEEEIEKKLQELEREGKSLMDMLREERKSLTEVIKEMGDNLQDLVEMGELPMGITAFVVKTKETILRHGEKVREHPEWRGSYEGTHEICTSIVEVPLKTPEGTILGMIKIENHEKSDSVREFKDLDKSTIYCFTDRHKEILAILADSVIIAIENILYRADTYKKIFGTEILRKIDELKVDNPKVNEDIYIRLKEFYNQLKIEIEDIGGMDEIYNKVTRLVSDIASILKLQATLDIIDNIGPSFESLLGTDVRYREHFMHQFQVFLLGYYLINKKSSLREELIKYLQNINPQYGLEDVLKVLFIASMFHDFGYSVGKMESWLKNYFVRVDVPSEFQIRWADIFVYYEVEKTNLVELISRNSNKPKDEIANILKDAFINEHDHGVISGLVLMNILHNHQIDETLLREACCAITLHTEAVYSRFGKLTIDQFPFAFLLVFCDNAQQWGRPRMMTLIPDMDVKLEDIITGNCTKVEMKLRYQKLTPEQKRIIEINTSPSTKYWYSKESLRFSIGLYEGDEKEPFRRYIFPFD